jgi:hypothetical protein
MAAPKHEIITFKVESSLAQAIRLLPNRSAFIRGAILTALDNACPLCQGTGTLTPEQKRHWGDFAEHHRLTHCAQCDAVYLECERDKPARGARA